MRPAAEPRIALAGDIGGTKTILSLFRTGSGRPDPIAEAVYASADASGLDELIRDFLGSRDEHVEAACFGVAGPVRHGHCKITNLPWEISEDGIKRGFGFRHVRLVNDLAATGYGVELLRRDELTTLNDKPVEPDSLAAVIAPGTGLGMTLLAPGHGGFRPHASEGGHIDFAPRNDEEMELWKYMKRDGEHVSVERLLSGPGIMTIYGWLVENGRFVVPERFKSGFHGADPAAAISRAAIEDGEPVAVKTMRMFVSILGAVAGNIALIGLTRGGIYLGGGIPPKIRSLLSEGLFMDSFLDKGRFRELLTEIPIFIIMNPRTGLLGAAHCAGRLGASTCNREAD